MITVTDAHGRFLHELPDHLADRLRYLRRSRWLRVGQWLLADKVAVVLDGIVAVTQRHPEGHDVLMSFRGPGGLVGENLALTDQGDQPQAAAVPYAWAVTGVEVVYLDPAEFRRFLRDNPPAGIALAQELAGRLQEAEHRLSAAACENSDQRLARLLLTMPTARLEDDGAVTVTGLSKAEMASWVGVRRETIERRLKDWRKSGTIRTGYREVTLVDIARLSRIAKLFPVVEQGTAA